MVKSAIYCYKTLHGILPDTGWLLILAGSIMLLFCRIRKPREVAEDRKPLISSAQQCSVGRLSIRYAVNLINTVWFFFLEVDQPSS